MVWPHSSWNNSSTSFKSFPLDPRPRLSSLVRRLSSRSAPSSWAVAPHLTSPSSATPDSEEEVLLTPESSIESVWSPTYSILRASLPPCSDMHHGQPAPGHRTPIRVTPNKAFLSTPPRGPREAALVDSLTRLPAPDSAVAALDEYAWHSLVSGVKVRDYCSAAFAAVSGSITAQQSSRSTRLALGQSPTRTLYPFLLPVGSPASAAPTLPPHVLANLTRRQLVDSLLHLEGAEHLDEQVQELVLEYIGRRWRLDHGDVEAITRKLAEVEADVAYAGPLQQPSRAKSIRSVLASLHSSTLHLGFVTSESLIIYLNAHSADSVTFIRTWAVRRLSSGIEPQMVALDLSAMQDRLIQPVREAISTVLASLCLDARTPTSAEIERPRTRTLSRISLRAKRKTLPIHQWLAPRHVAKLQAEDRRPSLPAFQTDSTPLRVHTPPTPPPDKSECSTPSSSSSRRSPLVPTSPRVPSPRSPPQFSPNSLGLSTETESRASLVDHLLSLRYRLGHDADAWYLGNGRDRAIDFLDGIDAVASHMRATTSQLREAFDLVDHTPTASTLHFRDVSFDLDQYLADVGPIDGDSNSPASSMLHRRHVPHGSFSSVDTMDSSITATTMTSERCSTFSTFAICQAQLAYTAPAAKAYRFPLSATDDLILPTPIDIPQYPRFAQSLPDVNDTYTRLPDRRTRIRQPQELLPPFDPSQSDAMPAARGERRKMYRQCVIVDGAVSPNRTSFGDEATALGMILSLFAGGRNPTAAEVEHCLIAAVEREAERAVARGDVFDAEARARVAWLLEQVGHELARPDLVSAVERVMERISSPQISPHSSSLRPLSRLTIHVPPRTSSQYTVTSGSSSSTPVPSPRSQLEVPETVSLQRRSAIRQPPDRVSLPLSAPPPSMPERTSLPTLGHARTSTFGSTPTLSPPVSSLVHAL